MQIAAGNGIIGMLMQKNRAVKGMKPAGRDCCRIELPGHAKPEVIR